LELAYRTVRKGDPLICLPWRTDAGSPPAIVAEFAALLPQATVVTQPGSGHFPWLDDPASFTEAIDAFLG
jgi:proline iminopeptidase